MPAQRPTPKPGRVIQIIGKYVSDSALKDLLNDKHGENFAVHNLENEVLVEVPIGCELTDDEIESTMSLGPQDPNERNEQAVGIRKILLKLETNLGEEYPTRSPYIPSEDLKRVVSEGVIGEWVDVCCPSAINPKRLISKIWDSALATFCILVTLEKDHFIRPFIEYPYSADDRLPWASEQSLTGFMKSSSMKMEYKLDSSDQKRFLGEQWKYRPIIIKEGDMLRLSHEKMVVPYMKHETISSKLHRVKLDARYFEPLKSQEPIAKGSIEMMMKTIDDTEKAEQRLLHYMHFLSIDIDGIPPPILRLYASYQLEKEIHLLTAVYDTDLTRFLLQDETPNNVLDIWGYLSAMVDLSCALDYIHHLPENRHYSKYVIHCDIKPANIFLSSGSFILADFGISSLHSPSEGREKDDNGRVDWYTAPERYSRKSGQPGEASAASDVFSMGCVFLEMLAHMRGKRLGVTEFRERRAKSSPNPSPYASFFCVDSRVVPAVRDELLDARPAIWPKEIDQVIDLIAKMLEESPEDRISTRTLFHDLENILRAAKLRLEDDKQKSDFLPDQSSISTSTPQTSVEKILSRPHGSALSSSETVGMADDSFSSVYQPGAKATEFTDLKDLETFRNEIGPSAINHEGDLATTLTHEFTIIEQGSSKAIWEKRSLREFAASEQSRRLLLHSKDEEDDLDEVLRTIAARTVQSVRQCQHTRDMITIFHFCHRHRRKGSEAVKIMMHSLLCQLVANLSNIAGSVVKSDGSRRQDAAGLMLTFTDLVKALPSTTTLVCIIDSLPSYCDDDRKPQMRDVLPGMLALASHIAPQQCRFKLLVTATGSRFCHRFRTEYNWGENNSSVYDDGGLMDDLHGYSERDFKKHSLTWN